MNSKVLLAFCVVVSIMQLLFKLIYSYVVCLDPHDSNSKLDITITIKMLYLHIKFYF